MPPAASLTCLANGSLRFFNRDVILLQARVLKEVQADENSWCQALCFFSCLVKRKRCWIYTSAESACWAVSLWLPPAERCRAAWAEKRRKWRARACWTTARRFSTATWPLRRTTSTPCSWPPATSRLTYLFSCCAWWGMCWSASSW